MKPRIRIETNDWQDFERFTIQAWLNPKFAELYVNGNTGLKVPSFMKLKYCSSLYNRLLILIGAETLIRAEFLEHLISPDFKNNNL